jgi:hypothetical protein
VDVLLDELLGGEDDAAEAAPLPVDVFCRRIDDAVGAELEGLLPNRAREYVVDHELGAGRAGDLGHRRDIDDLEGRIGRAFQEEHFRFRPHRGAPGVEIGAMHQRGLHAEARQQLSYDVAA